MRFSIEAGDRWEALDLRDELDGFSPWMVEVARGSFLVQGTVVPAKIEGLRMVVERWARERARDPRLQLLEPHDGGTVVH